MNIFWPKQISTCSSFFFVIKSFFYEIHYPIHFNEVRSIMNNGLKRHLSTSLFYFFYLVRESRVQIFNKAHWSFSVNVNFITIIESTHIQKPLGFFFFYAQNNLPASIVKDFIITIRVNWRIAQRASIDSTAERVFLLHFERSLIWRIIICKNKKLSEVSFLPPPKECDDLLNIILKICSACLAL
jgi:hypothetical protein